MKASAKDLRFRTKELLDAVNGGEEVAITFGGKPCAKLVPYEDEEKETTENELFGIWKDHPGVVDVDEYVRKARDGRF